MEAELVEEAEAARSQAEAVKTVAAEAAKEEGTLALVPCILMMICVYVEAEVVANKAEHAEAARMHATRQNAPFLGAQLEHMFSEAQSISRLQQYVTLAKQVQVHEVVASATERAEAARVEAELAEEAEAARLHADAVEAEAVTTEKAAKKEGTLALALRMLVMSCICTQLRASNMRLSRTKLSALRRHA